MTRVRGLAVTFLAVVVTVSCSSSESPGGSDAGNGNGTAAKVADAIRVPQDHDTIQTAVDAAEPGDLILVDKGVYEEAVDVTTPYVTIRAVGTI